jgi:hypothetical protein
MIRWAIPVMMIPAMIEKPFCTDPAWVITSPTNIPPIELHSIGTQQLSVQCWYTPAAAICLPSSEKVRLISRDTVEYTASSIVNRKEFRLFVVPCLTTVNTPGQGGRGVIIRIEVRLAYI